MTTVSRDLSPADDRFHAIADPSPMWTETTWWGFMVPERALGGMVYTLFRPNLGVATVVTQVWDAEATEPWRAPYARGQWHVRMPEGDLDDVQVGLLRLRALDPLQAYHLAYEDGDALTLDLRFNAVMAPNVVAAEASLGHFDQLGRVTGQVRLGGESIAIDCLAIRDRSWYVRDDLRSMRAGYTYGSVDENEHFLAFSRPSGDTDEYPINGGYLVRDGVKSALESGVRRVVSRRRGHPDEITITATDADGRPLSVEGRVTASLASQSTPGMFAWMSIADWQIDGRSASGEDHDVWSPDRLARPAAKGPA